SISNWNKAMSNTYTSISRLEQLPDELWLLILAHLSPTDRLRAFGNLNCRFNAILCEAGIGVDDAMALDFDLLSKLSSSITVINLQRRCEVINMYRLERIRSLIMSCILRHQIIAIDPIYMPNLTVLRLASPSNTHNACYGRLLEYILNQNF